MEKFFVTIATGDFGRLPMLTATLSSILPHLRNHRVFLGFNYSKEDRHLIGEAGDKDSYWEKYLGPILQTAKYLGVNLECVFTSSSNTFAQTNRKLVEAGIRKMEDEGEDLEDILWLKVDDDHIFHPHTMAKLKDTALMMPAWANVICLGQFDVQNGGGYTDWSSELIGFENILEVCKRNSVRALAFKRWKEADDCYEKILLKTDALTHCYMVRVTSPFMAPFWEEVCKLTKGTRGFGTILKKHIPGGSIGLLLGAPVFHVGTNLGFVGNELWSNVSEQSTQLPPVDEKLA